MHCLKVYTGYGMCTYIIKKNQKLLHNRKEEITTEKNTMNKSNNKEMIITIGKLSAFLSCCAVGLIPCTIDEREAFMVVS